MAALRIIGMAIAAPIFIVVCAIAGFVVVIIVVVFYRERH